MGKNRLVYLITVLLLLYYCILYNQKSTFLIFLAVLIYPWIMGIFMWIAARKTRFHIEVLSPFVEKGSNCSVRLNIQNQSIFPVPALQIEFMYGNCLEAVKQRKVFFASILGKSTQEITIQLASDYVGEIQFFAKKVRFMDATKVIAYQLSKRKREQISTDTIVVLPKQDRLLETIIFDGQSETGENPISKNQRGSDTSEVIGSREYQPGDRLSSIHWKLTAKHDQLMMREYAATKAYHPLFALDFSSVKRPSIVRLDAFYETFMFLASLHLQQNIPIQVIYRQEKGSIESETVRDREELQFLFQPLFHAARNYWSESIKHEVFRQENALWNTGGYYLTMEYPLDLGEQEAHWLDTLLIEEEQKEFSEELVRQMSRRDRFYSIRPKKLEEDLQWILREREEVTNLET